MTKRAKKYKRMPQYIIAKIEDLKKEFRTNPFPEEYDIKEMKITGSYRIRVGKIRIVYDVLHEKRIIAIHKIDYRGRVYKG